MTRRASESGFTLLEILVASMLLGMLITILTMVFNSSSIAWSTGKATVSEMDDVRLKVSVASMGADNAMPGVDANNRNAWGYLVSPWDRNGKLRNRAIVQNAVCDGVLAKPSFNSDGTWIYKTGKLWATLHPQSVSILGKAKSYAVGVWSYGPDGQPNTGDDISTWPDVE